MTAASHRSKLRLIVLQTLVFSLLATLGARLYYLQVISGEEYQGQAASQSVREIVVQPQRGLVVDAMGRPLVTNRLTWVVSMDRTLIGKMSEADRTELLARTARAIGMKVPRITAKLLLCGDEGSVAGECWNGSPYQPVPVAQDVKETAALRILEQPEDFPGVVVDRQSVRQYPAPYGINAAHLLGYLSPITKDELEAAEDDGDSSVNGASVVGRAGVEKEYDEFLRGQPGYQQVAVDSRGRVRQDVSDLAAQPGDTLVTSIDANVQAVVEEQLAKMIKTQRATRDPVTKRNFEADSGAAVVMEARTGRIVAMASQPTYDPSVWVGGITDKQLERLYSEAAGTPLLSRAFQGQFAPGSTWKPFMSVGALTHGYRTDTILGCPSAVQIGNRAFHNHESGAYGSIDFARALEVSCNTFFYQVGMHFWQELGSDPDDVNAKDPLVSEAEEFGFGERTGVDLPGEASGRVADRKWKKAYYESMKDYYCGIADKPQGKGTSDFVYKFSREFCIEGWKYKITDSAQLRHRAGRHHRDAAAARPRVRRHLQRRHALGAARRQGDRVTRRRGDPRDRTEEGARPQDPEAGADVRRPGAPGRRLPRHDGVEARRLPAGRGHHPRQDRLRRGLREAVDRLGGVVHQGLRRRDDDQPGRHRLRLDGRGRARHLGGALRRRRREGRQGPRRDPRRHATGDAADVRRRRVDPAARPGRSAERR